MFAMVFNPDFEALEANQAAAGENINKTILTVKDFRMAMSLAMNRAEFCLATSPLNQPPLRCMAARSSRIRTTVSLPQHRRGQERCGELLGPGR